MTFNLDVFQECKGKLMKNMGQLWLQAEVKDLESRVRKTPCDFSPYLVVDAEALIEHIFLIKQLVGSRQFIVVIPAVGKSSSAKESRKLARHLSVSASYLSLSSQKATLIILMLKGNAFDAQYKI